MQLEPSSLNAMREQEKRVILASLAKQEPDKSSHEFCEHVRASRFSVLSPCKHAPPTLVIPHA